MTFSNTHVTGNCSICPQSKVRPETHLTVCVPNAAGAHKPPWRASLGHYPGRLAATPGGIAQDLFWRGRQRGVFRNDGSRLRR